MSRLVPFLHPDEVPAMPATARRERRHACDYRYVRKVRGRLYQARLWVGGVGSVNLGLYPTEAAARRAVKAVLGNRTGGPLTAVTVWAAVRPAVAAGVVPARVLPKWVHRTPDGRFGAKCRLASGPIELGPFDDPESACDAMAAHLAAYRPRP